MTNGVYSIGDQEVKKYKKNLKLLVIHPKYYSKLNLEPGSRAGLNSFLCGIANRLMWGKK